jgi:polyisoprenoid-binding protein YceI
MTASLLEVTVETISTLFAARDEDLRSDRFLGSKAHPTMTYRSTRAVESPRAGWRVLDEPTVRGITKRVPLAVRFAGSITDSSGKPRAAFHASGTPPEEISAWSLN